MAYPYLSSPIIKRLKDFDIKYPNTLRFFLDSGAFTAHNSGKIISVDQYCSFLDSLPIRPWRYIALDAIGNEAKTKKNYELMLSRGYSPVPVYTQGADWSDVEYYYSTSDFICFGGLVGKKGSGLVINAIDKFLAIANGRKSHLLGYTSVPYLKKFKPYSCDSSSWESGARFGTVPVYLQQGKMLNLDKKKIINNPSDEVKKALRAMDVDMEKIKSLEGWTGGDSEIRKTCAKSWGRLSVDIEKNLGTKLFLALATDHALKLIINAYESQILTRLKI